MEGIPIEKQDAIYSITSHRRTISKTGRNSKCQRTQFKHAYSDNINKVFGEV